MKRVLLVEDEIVIAMGIRLLLEAEGYELRVASNGREGLEMALAGSPDLIITDYMMPRLDGLAMVHALRKAGVTTPVIICTSIPESRLGGNPDADYNAYLSKPIREDELIALVRSFLEDES